MSGFHGFYTGGPTNEDILNFFNRSRHPHMKDVTPPGFRSTPKPTPRTVELHATPEAGPRTFRVMMPNGLYLGGVTGNPYCLRLKAEASISRQEIAIEKFTRVHNKFKEFWP